MELQFDMCVCDGRYKIKDKWDRAGEEGDYFGWIEINGMKWAIILAEGEEDPDFYKADGLLVQTGWKSLLPN